MALVQYGGGGGGSQPIILPARYTTTANITLSGLGTAAGRDWGSALTAGDRILVKAQTNAYDNGVYVAAAGAWARSSDMDSSAEVVPGMLVSVAEGVTLADTLWELSANAPITIGVTNLTFIRINDGWSLTGNAGTTAGTNFVGTTDGQDLVFKRNSSEKFRLNADGVIIGSTVGYFGGENLFSKGYSHFDINANNFRVFNAAVGSDDLLGVYANYSRMKKPLVVNGTGLFVGNELFVVADGTFNPYYAVSSTGLSAFNLRADYATALIHGKGTGATSATYTMKLDNSASTPLFYVRNDGNISAGVDENLTIGESSYFALGHAQENVYIGYGIANSSATSQGGNVGIGTRVFEDLTSGSYNTAIGYRAAFNLTTGERNAAFGNQALYTGAEIHYCSAFGQNALYSNLASHNTAVGYNSMTSNTSGERNTSLGTESMRLHQTGDKNTSIGMNSLYNGTGLDSCVALGYGAGFYETANSKLFIDNQVRGGEADGRVKALIYGEFHSSTGSQLVRVNSNFEFRENFINSNKEINTTAGDSATVNAVSGRFRKDTSGTTFTLTNSLITANSIIILTAANAAIDATATGWTASAGSGSATITFNAAPTANFDMNFFIIN